MEVSERQWWTGHEWLLAVYALQRIDMEAQANSRGEGDTEGLLRMIGSNPELRMDDGGSLLAGVIAVVQAFAMEKLLKSLLSSEGHDTDGSRDYWIHDLSKLRKMLSKGAQNALEREYRVWLEQARMVVERKGKYGNPGVLEDLDRDIWGLLERHKNDFKDLRYTEGVNGSEIPSCFT